MISNQKVRSLIKVLKPWLLAFALVLILRYTGAISGLSVVTQSALFETGLMDFNPGENTAEATSFNYDFTLKDLKGNVIDFNQFKDKVIFLNMWATWCGPCRVEMPSIQSLYETVDQDKVVFIMLSLDTPENHQKIIKFTDKKEYTFPVYVPNESLPRQLKVSSIPTTFIIGKDGKIKSKKVGTANYDTAEFKEFLNSLTEP